MAKNNNLKDFLTDVADTIRAKKGTTDKINPQDFSAEIASIETSGGGGGTAPVSKGDVTFYDYDGVVLHSYTKDEFLALSAMPNLPEREGLICQEWNWSFEDARDYVNKYGYLNIGASYTTDNGRTRIFISLTETKRSVSLTCRGNKSNSLTVFWGDGKSTTSQANFSHTYDTPGEYIIEIEVASDAVMTFGNSNTNSTSSSYYNGTLLGDASSPNQSKNFNIVKEINIGDRVNILGGGVVYNFKCLSKCSISTSVQQIRKYAFRSSGVTCIVLPKNCSVEEDFVSTTYNLTTLVFPQKIDDAIPLYCRSCSAVKKITLPHATLGVQCFHNNDLLELIVIPDSIETIPQKAFYNCHNLKNIIAPSVSKIEKDSFYNCRSLKSFKTTAALEVGTSAFYNCSSLLEISALSYNVMENSFSSCYNLKSIVGKIKQVSKNAFSECKLLTTPYLDENITYVGGFSNCYSLRYANIPKNVISLGSLAFNKCYNLKYINLQELNSLTTIENECFYSCPIEEVVLPNTLQTVGNSAFSNTYIKEITLPDSITELGQYAFDNCKYLEYIKLSENITSIKQYTFGSCNSLLNIKIPKKVMSIENYALNTSSLKNVDFSEHESVPTLGNTTAFNSSYIKNIIVPDVLYDEWKAATNWSTYASKIIKKSDWDASQS